MVLAPDGRSLAAASLTHGISLWDLETGKEKRRLDMWPFFTWHRDAQGSERLQVLALLEPVLPESRGIERNWSPLCAPSTTFPISRTDWSRIFASNRKTAPVTRRCCGTYTPDKRLRLS